MKAAFRVDSSIEIGSGHVMRCLTLANELKVLGFEILFVSRDLPGNISELIKQQRFELFLLPKPNTYPIKQPMEVNVAHSNWLGVTALTDAEETLEVLISSEIDFLIVDHYALESEWERKMRCGVKKIMAIDDLADRHHDCDLLLDQNLGRLPSDYKALVSDSCKLLVGPRYALLRPEFERLRQVSLVKRNSQNIKRILISLGGVDYCNATKVVLNALRDTYLNSDVKLDIVMGSHAPHLMEIKNIVRNLPFKATVSINVNDMAMRMSNADLVIGAGGSTSWERACLGVPSVVIVVADNQRLISYSLRDAGAATVLEFEEIASHLPQVINLLLFTKGESLEAMSKAAAKLTDGNGAKRVAQVVYDTAKNHGYNFM